MVARCQSGAVLLIVAALLAGAAPAWAHPVKIVAFGDSLSAGYQLPADAAFPAVLERALRKDGFDVAVANAGVSGDTASGGLDRVQWSVPDGTDLAIVELGANDMLRGFDPAMTRTALTGILTNLTARHVKTILAGMYAAPNLDQTYREQFDAIYPSLAHQFGATLYSFFLAGIIGHPELHIADGLHPNPAGVEVIVRNILPTVEDVLKGMGAKG